MPSFCCRQYEVSRLQSPSVTLQMKACCVWEAINGCRSFSFTVLNWTERASRAPLAPGVFSKLADAFCGEQISLSHSGERGRSHRVEKSEGDAGCHQQPLSMLPLSQGSGTCLLFLLFLFFPSLPACLSCAVGKLDFQIKKAAWDEDSRFLLPFNNHPCLLFGESSLYISFLNVPSKWRECL